VLRQSFTRWGLPKAIRVDNGTPWATQSDIPSALALWLVGLGVRVLLNRPRHSTDNGIVERDHGVLAQWVEAEQAANEPALQRRLEWAVGMQRERYPVKAGQSRLELYPTLQTNARRYTREAEGVMWQMERVARELSQRIWRRRVDKVGRISLFSEDYSVGRRYSKQDVLVRLDGESREWVIESEQGQALKRVPNRTVTAERILALDLAKRANPASRLPG